MTLALTLFASWAWGFTLNRVSLFALIFSIGILVDDAIVVVENIHRHMAMSKGKLLDLMPRAVDEVGGPTILATFTVIAALLPMAFVTGLMGPYMSPIPINASTGMLISLVVAFVFTPWMTNFMLGKRHAAGPGGQAAAVDTVRVMTKGGGGMQRLFDRVIGPFLSGAKGNRNRWLLLAGHPAPDRRVVVALVTSKVVILKMLPFDNKSEFQVVLDMPEGTSLEQTARVLAEMGEYLATVPEVTDYQVYAGTRHAHQLQRPGAPVLPARGRPPGGHPGQPGGPAPPRPPVPRHRRGPARRPCRRSPGKPQGQRQDRRDPARAAGAVAPGR